MALTFGTLDFAVAFSRQTAFPLDAKSYFESLELAQAAAATAQEAGSSETVYYFGQTIAVVENSKATLYVIQPDKTLKEVGGNVLIDENAFIKTTDGKLSLLGFADAVGGAQLVKTEDGKISWVKPDTTTVEGLSTVIESLKTVVGDDKSGLVKQVADNKAAIEVLNGDSAKEGSVAYQIAQIVADAPTSFDTLKEIADWINTHGNDATAMNSQINTNKSDITSLKGLVGKTSVASQIDGALKVDGADKYALASHSHEIGNITGLQAALNNKAAATTVEALQGTVNELSSKAHEHANKTVLDSITAEKINNWDAAQTNILEAISIGGVDAPISEKKVDIPVATAEKLGVVKSSSTKDQIAVGADGIMSINTVSISKIVQAADETLIINGGNSGLTIGE